MDMLGAVSGEVTKHSIFGSVRVGPKGSFSSKMIYSSLGLMDFTKS